jgi:hypothetical protein
VELTALSGYLPPGTPPGSRIESTAWVDENGTFWLFSGYGDDAAGKQGGMNDLWRYSAGEWTWMGGSNLYTGSNNFPMPTVYGTLGVSAPSNDPGGRYSLVLAGSTVLEIYGSSVAAQVVRTTMTCGSMNHSE